MLLSSRSARSASRQPPLPSTRSSRSSTSSTRTSCDCIDEMCETCALYRPVHLSQGYLGTTCPSSSSASYSTTTSTGTSTSTTSTSSSFDRDESYASARETFAFDRTLYEDSSGTTVTPSTINLPNDEIDIDFVRDVRLITPGTLKHPLRKPTLLQRFAITQRYLVKAPNQKPLPNCLLHLHNGTTFPINVDRPSHLKHAIADARAFVYRS